jgi:hypothetical protein
VTPHELPELLQRAMAFILVGIGIGLAVMHTLLVALAAQRSSLPARKQVAAVAAVGVYLTAWVALAITFGDPRNFPLDREKLRLPLTVVVGFGPMIVGIVSVFLVKSLRQINAAMPTTWLIWAQAYRVAGFIFLYPYLYYGIVPAGFAYPAAVGDFLAGIWTPLVALAVARRRPNAVMWATVWNVFGIVDLLTAPVAAFLAGAGVINLYPITLVPLFVGPPMGILAHVYSIRNLRVAASAVASGGSSESLERPESLKGALGLRLGRRQTTVRGSVAKWSCRD